MLKQLYRLLMPEKLRTYIYLKRSGKYFEERKLIKVYSHPRSGTHFLEAFLARNFYKGIDLRTEIGEWGHWDNRLPLDEVNIYGKLFGNHQFPGKWIKEIKHPMIYIYRDGRDVAYSIWKTPNFINPKHDGISFSDFLRIKIDWEGTPGKQCKPKENIIQHWERHVREWHKVKHPKLLIIKYENLKTKPIKCYEKILKKFFPVRYILYRLKIFKPNIDTISKPVGLRPNKAKAQDWKNNFTKDDNLFFLNQIKNKKFIINE